MTNHKTIAKGETVGSILGAHDVEREALIAFYELDCLPTKALRLRQGEPFDYLDLRALEGLRAAAEKLAA